MNIIKLKKTRRTGRDWLVHEYEHYQNKDWSAGVPKTKIKLSESRDLGHFFPTIAYGIRIEFHVA